jgi:hypothetical protein
MTLRSEEGGAVVAFRGAGNLVEWREYVDGWAQREGWHAAADWDSLGETWHRCLENENKTKLDVHIMASSKDSQLMGLATVTPPPSRAEK